MKTGSPIWQIYANCIRHVVITVDESDFPVYRRNKREIIPMVCTPRS